MQEQVLVAGGVPVAGAVPMTPPLSIAVNMRDVYSTETVDDVQLQTEIRLLRCRSTWGHPGAWPFLHQRYRLGSHAIVWPWLL
jgi:hypothetical protein